MNTIKNGIMDESGVISVDVDLKGESAMIEYDSEKISASKLVEAIEDLGFEAELLEVFDKILNFF